MTFIAKGGVAPYSDKVNRQFALDPNQGVQPAAPDSWTDSDRAFIEQQKQSYISEFTRRAGRPPSQEVLEQMFGQGSPNAQRIVAGNPYRAAPGGTAGTATNPQPGSVGVNDPRFLVAGMFRPGQNTEYLAAARANLSGNAAYNSVFQFNPATGQMELRPNTYQLDPLSGQYDPNQWADNNFALVHGQNQMAQGRKTGQNLFNEAGYRGALNAGQQATQVVGSQAARMGATDRASSARQSNQLDEYGQDIGLLRASAQGTGPSAAEALAKSQLYNNIRAQASMAAGARGGNVAAAQRAAALASSNMQMQSAQQMSAMRAQEQLTAQAQLAAAQGQRAQAMGMARGQDLQKGFQNVQGAAMAAQAAQGQTAAQAGFTGAQQAQFGLGLNQTQMGMQQYQAALGNQLNMMGLQAQVAGQQSAGAIAGQNQAIDLYKIAQGTYQGEVNRNDAQIRYEQQMAQQRKAAQDAQTASIIGMGVGAFSPFLASAMAPSPAAPAPAASGPTMPGSNGLINPWA